MKRWVAIAALCLSACATTPMPQSYEAPLYKQALATEQDAAKRYGRGDYVGAKLNFAEAARLYQSIDDVSASERSQVHAARAELALGQSDAALKRLSELFEPDEVEALSVAAQARLALGDAGAAQAIVSRALAQCPAVCEMHASLRLLQARASLAQGKPDIAAADAEAVLKLLQGKDEPRETANAQRLLATARLALGDGVTALSAAQAALEADRRQGLPEKIARDWLLLGAIQTKAGNASAAQQAYRRAQAVARAAGLDDIAKSADVELKKGVAK